MKKERRQYPAAFWYAVCGVGLAFSVLLALLLPDWYSEWSDSRTFQEVVTKEREAIAFVDSQEMGASQRMRAVAQMEEITLEDFETVYGLVEPEDPLRVLEQCAQSLEDWTEAGILPEGYLYLCRDVIAGAEIENMDALAVEGYMYYTYVNTSLGRIPLYVIAMAQGSETEGNQGHVLHLVMDADTGFLYYVSVMGQEAAAYLAREGGFSSVEEMLNAYLFGSVWESGGMTVADYGRAGLAQSAEVDPMDEHGLELDITLEYGDYSGKAYRVLERSDWGTGYTVMYGSLSWMGYMQAVMEMHGWPQYSAGVEDWMQHTYEVTYKYEDYIF